MQGTIKRAPTPPKVDLDGPVRFLKGVGPERSKLLARLGLNTLRDLLYFFPRRYENRSPVKKVAELTLGEKECVRGVVISRRLIRTRFGPSIFRVVLGDEEISVEASAETPLLHGTWFNMPYLTKLFEPKAQVVFYGRPEKDGKHLKMVHPEYEIFSEGVATNSPHSGRVVPIYPLTEDLSQKGLRQLAFQTVEECAPLVRETLPSPFLKRLGLKSVHFSLKQLHFPEGREEYKQAYRRLVFDEFFMLQVLIQMKKAKLQKENKAISHSGGQELVRRFIQTLEFELTPGQQKTINDILADMKKGRSMNRLVQGDVGSGKTVVAAAALVFTAANGFQGALMAPTEVLAQQQYFSLARFLEPFGIRCGYLAQNSLPEEKALVLSGLADGTLQVIVGTHALIQENVRFKNLGLVVIDEQHKFGVFQRAALKEKALVSPHFLLLTATPIPRTLAHTLYGDLDISLMQEMPKGRQPIRTLWVGQSKRAEIYQFIDRVIAKGEQVFVVCPAVDAKNLSVKNATESYESIRRIFSHRRVGLLHGRLKSPEKKKIMQDFKEKKIQLLVSTVVIEVGIDVPNATVMVIENAERFGLSQLHQLRGRVGRGPVESSCILFSDAADEETVRRLEAFTSISSGFEIAEKDLELRGAGDIIGARQHGLPELRIGDLVKDAKVLIEARREAIALVEKDPTLSRLENRLLRDAIRRRFASADLKKLTVTA